MEKKKRVFGIIICILVACLAGALVIGVYNTNSDVASNTDTQNNTTDGGADKAFISCFDLLDKQLTADGFTHLEGSMWGRGEKNRFLYDVVAQEFHVPFMFANFDELPADWYKNDFDRHVFLTYNFMDDETWSATYLKSGGSKDSPSATVEYDRTGIEGHMSFEFRPWMEYYNGVMDSYGCSLADLTVEELTGAYRTTLSSATEADIVSVFDRKSEDGVLRYFADAHVEGNIEDHPRYNELQTKEEYYALGPTIDFEEFYFINVMYRDPTTRPMLRDIRSMHSSIIKEFTKDVVFPNTTWIGDEPRRRTFGVYFIYVDNPSGEFEYMYTPPKVIDGAAQYSLEDFESIRTPFNGFIMISNKSDMEAGVVYQIAPMEKRETLEFYLGLIKDYNPNFEYADEFLTNYSRPFDKDWQTFMGLGELFDEKFGFVNRDVEYRDGR